MEKKTDRQKNWCWCSKCEGLFYVDNNWLSFCPAGGSHDESFFNDFAYSVNTENKGEAGWRKCSRCLSLFLDETLVWANSNTVYLQQVAPCPAPGKGYLGPYHEADTSVKYYMEKNNFSDSSLQTGWRYCSKCRGLYFGGHATKGKCPGGGTHDNSDKGNYALCVE
jgi:hypothetical protein